MREWSQVSNGPNGKKNNRALSKKKERERKRTMKDDEIISDKEIFEVNSHSIKF